jgi:hypothetical protein
VPFPELDAAPVRRAIERHAACRPPLPERIETSREMPEGIAIPSPLQRSIELTKRFRTHRQMQAPQLRAEASGYSAGFGNAVQ